MRCEVVLGGGGFGKSKGGGVTSQNKHGDPKFTKCLSCLIGLTNSSMQIIPAFKFLPSPHAQRFVVSTLSIFGIIPMALPACGVWMVVVVRPKAFLAEGLTFEGEWLFLLPAQIQPSAVVRTTLLVHSSSGLALVLHSLLKAPFEPHPQNAQTHLVFEVLVGLTMQAQDAALSAWPRGKPLDRKQ